MAQYGPFSAGEHGRYPVRANAEPLVADSVDAAVEQVETTGFDAALDHAVGQAGSEDLRPREDAMLTCCEVGDRTFALCQRLFALDETPSTPVHLTWLQLTTDTVVKCAQARSSPRLGWRDSRSLRPAGG